MPYSSQRGGSAKNDYAAFDVAGSTEGTLCGLRETQRKTSHSEGSSDFDGHDPPPKKIQHTENCRLGHVRDHHGDVLSTACQLHASASCTACPYLPTSTLKLLKGAGKQSQAKTETRAISCFARLTQLARTPNASPAGCGDRLLREGYSAFWRGHAMIHAGFRKACFQDGCRK